MVDPIKAHVWWDIYVKAVGMRELREAHLLPISASLENVECDWDISTEQENPGLFRIVTCQNFEGASVQEIVVPVLRCAYRLSNEWKISGLEVLASSEIDNVHGQWQTTTPASNPPSLASMIFDIRRGHIRRASPEEAAAAGWTMGAWRLVDTLPR
jgi:hypothetical protein